MARVAREKLPPAPPCCSGNLDSHEAEREELGQNIEVELRGLVHGRDVRPDLGLRKLAHGFLKEDLFFGELGEGNGYVS